MSDLLWRIIIAVLAVALLLALLPPVLNVLGLGVSADVLKILKLCIAGIALFYVLRGRPL